MTQLLHKFRAIIIIGLSLGVPTLSSANVILHAGLLPISKSVNQNAQKTYEPIVKIAQITDPLTFPAYEKKPPSLTDKAKRYFRVGVRNFKKENWEEAKVAFEAFLRSSDNILRKDAYYYLANIHSKLGDERQSLYYVKAYHGFNDTYVTEDCISLVSSLDSEFLGLVESANLGLISPEEFEPKLIKLIDKQGPDFAKTCQLVSKNRAGHAEFLESE